MQCLSRAGSDMFKYGEKHSHAEESSGAPKSPETVFQQFPCVPSFQLGQAAGEEEASKLRSSETQLL